MTNPTDRPGPQVWHTLRYHDAPAALGYLVEVFGFEVVLRVDSGDDPEIVEHAQLRWPEGDSGIMLGSHRESPEWPSPTGHAACYVSTDHVTEIWARVQKAGFRVVNPLHEDGYDAGNPAAQSFGVADPEGNLWSFGSYRGES